MNPESPAGVVLLGLAAWVAVLVPVFLYRWLRPGSVPQAIEPEEPEADDGDEDYEPVPLVAEFTDAVPFDTGVLIGPPSRRGDA